IKFLEDDADSPELSRAKRILALHCARTNFNAISIFLSVHPCKALPISDSEMRWLLKFWLGFGDANFSGQLCPGCSKPDVSEHHFASCSTNSKAGHCLGHDKLRDALYSYMKRGSLVELYAEDRSLAREITSKRTDVTILHLANSHFACDHLDTVISDDFKEVDRVVLKLKSKDRKEGASFSDHFKVTNNSATRAVRSAFDSKLDTYKKARNELLKDRERQRNRDRSPNSVSLQQEAERIFCDQQGRLNVTPISL
ncbi:hypothetical protein ADUPG1_004420, partial [Aduncisulcus paluster]